MNDVVPFNFDGHAVRVTDRDGNPWFVLRDLLDAMGSKTKVTDAVESIRQGLGEGFVNDVPLQTAGGMQTAIIVAEPAATYLLSRSNTEKGRELNRFVHVEVLPAIRKTGSYALNPRDHALQLAPLATRAAQAFGFTGNQAVLSANRAIKHFHAHTGACA